MQFNEIAACFFMSALGGIAMTTSDDLEYYESFYTNYTHPFGVEGRITQEEAKNRKVYIVVKRDEKGRIISIKKIIDKKCFFHFIYSYKENGELDSFERGSCKSP